MATKTLILRPTASKLAENATESLYPTDTPLDEAYKTVNEEVADDDATYWIAESSIRPVNVSFTIPEEYLNITPTTIKVYCRAKAHGGDSTNFSISCVYDYNENLSENSTYTASSGYQTYFYELTTANIEAFYSIINNDWSTSTWHQVRVINTGTGNSKNIKLAVTQIYLEITYESSDESGDDTSEAIYIKENGSWVVIAGTIYRKENGTWVEVDSSVLQDGTQYVIMKEVE